MEKVNEFKHLGSTVQSSRECGKEVRKRGRAGRSGRRKVSGVICDKRVAARVTGKFYRGVARPAMLFSLETVALAK